MSIEHENSSNQLKEEINNSLSDIEEIKSESSPSSQEVNSKYDDSESDNSLGFEVSEDASEDSESAAEQSESQEDEYGNPTSKKSKVYTEDEVERLIKERIARVKNNSSQAEAPVKAKAATQEDWMTELKEVVKETLKEESLSYAERQLQAEQQQREAEFEHKFTSGMKKYTDFWDVLKNQPLSEAMVWATHKLENPAAFLYAAAKKQPEELKRIAEIRDPYAQMFEMGKLESKLRHQPAVVEHKKNIKVPASNKNKSFSDDIDKQIVEDEKRKFKSHGDRR